VRAPLAVRVAAAVGGLVGGVGARRRDGEAEIWLAY
jgi:hypothetical protein